MSPFAFGIGVGIGIAYWRNLPPLPSPVAAVVVLVPVIGILFAWWGGRRNGQSQSQVQVQVQEQEQHQAQAVQIIVGHEHQVAAVARSGDAARFGRQDSFSQVNATARPKALPSPLLDALSGLTSHTTETAPSWIAGISPGPELGEHAPLRVPACKGEVGAADPTTGRTLAGRGEGC